MSYFIQKKLRDSNVENYSMVQVISTLIIVIVKTLHKIEKRYS